jgi:hypothetical protein
VDLRQLDERRIQGRQQVTISGSTLTDSNNTNNNHTWTIAGISGDGTTPMLTVSNTVVAGRCCGLLDRRIKRPVNGYR